MENVYILAVEIVLTANFADLTTRILIPVDIKNVVTENLAACLSTLIRGLLLLFWAEAQDTKQIIDQTKA